MTSLPATPSPRIQTWLTHTGSFMQHAREQGITQPTVQVLKETWRVATAHERHWLDLSFRNSVWVRDVLIGSGSRHWMLARSVFPWQSLRGTGREFIHLKNRSLGSVLFQHPALERTPFEFFQLPPPGLWANMGQPLKTSVWARRSLFHLQQTTVLLTEAFLPDLERWINNSQNGIPCATTLP